jgi:multidrug efflux pump subunit AcrA (membrane-fusion protein)
MKLKPGMVCEVEITLPSTESVLTVPLSSVMRDANQQAYVYVVNPATKLAIKKNIWLDGIVDDKLVISSGLKAADLVIVGGNQKITNQTKVTF